METKYRYEKDLQCFVEFKSKNIKTYKKFESKYQEFLEKTGIKDNKIHYEVPAGVINYFIKNKGDIFILFKSIESANIGFEYSEINDLLKAFLPKLGLRNNTYLEIKNSKDLESCIDNTFKNRSYEAQKLLIYVLKIKLVENAEIICLIMNYINKVFKPFSKYCNLVLEKKPVPNELVSQIIELMSNKEFTIFNNNISLSKNELENARTYLEYTSNFIKYTNEYNESLSKVNVVHLGSNIKPAKEKNTVIKESISKDLKVSKTKENSSIKDNDTINNYVNSYFEILCSYNTSDVHNYLPNPSIPKYEEIMVALLQRYEEYLNEEALKNNNTMDKMNIYLMLEDCVNNLKS